MPAAAPLTEEIRKEKGLIVWSLNVNVFQLAWSLDFVVINKISFRFALTDEAKLTEGQAKLPNQNVRQAGSHSECKRIKPKSI